MTTREQDLARIARDVGERLEAYIATGRTPADVGELEERLELAAALLLAIEWVGAPHPYCPACSAVRDIDGEHADECALAAFIALLRR